MERSNSVVHTDKPTNKSLVPPEIASSPTWRAIWRGLLCPQDINGQGNARDRDSLAAGPAAGEVKATHEQPK